MDYQAEGNKVNRRPKLKGFSLQKFVIHCVPSLGVLDLGQIGVLQSEGQEAELRLQERHKRLLLLWPIQHRPRDGVVL